MLNSLLTLSALACQSAPALIINRVLLGLVVLEATGTAGKVNHRTLHALLLMRDVLHNSGGSNTDSGVDGVT